MRIAIDTRDLMIARTGARTFLEELCRVLPIVAPEHEYIFLSPASVPFGRSRVKRIFSHIAFYWWKEIELPYLVWKSKADIIFCSDYVVPLVSTATTIPVFFGANFWERPQDYNKFWRKLFDWLALPAAKKSPSIITISQASKQRLIDSVGILAEKINVVYIAPKQIAISHDNLENEAQILSHLGLLSGSYALHVGVLEKRKNLIRLIDAFVASLPQVPIEMKLVLAGQPASKIDMDDSQAIKDLIFHYNLAERIIIPGYIPDRDLAVLYKNAQFFIFPSLYEGFGLPILEAFGNKLPVAAANVAAIPEISGDAAILFDPFDIEEISRTIVKLSVDFELRQNLIEAGQARLKKFSWEKTALTLIEIFKNSIAIK